MDSSGSTQQHGSTHVAALHEALAQSIGRWTEGLEDCSTSIPNLGLFRRDTAVEPCVCLVEPSVVLVAQGAKQLQVGDEAYTYDIERFLVTSLDMPAVSRVLDASPERPCLGLVFKLDLRITAELIAQSGLPPPTEPAAERGMALGTLTPLLLEPLKRLVDLLDEPEAVPVLAPLLQREIHFRLLMSDQATRLWQIASAGSQGHRIARAIDWLKVNFALPLRIDELAARVQMSTSSLHHHFRQLTTMSPLQYQKWLRLNEARRLMLNEHLDAATAAFRVGYESPSQFSREYSRLFGQPPKRDIEGLLRKAEDASYSQAVANA
ncbi:AraC family transcriptional regulator [Ralstonia pseudosolanacearum]|uniref:Putative transcription regulator protein n=2 Tax=Ralstonia solanacearum species complex TaxID=3116862 RepID=A0A0S4WID2_RALSL|nr:AraC family transcriptional regulator [Ralstonia pseudosolanacearum]CUV46563.1 putative transcription regulator protein [Ralstonia solanacearum]MDO3510060.1 AraC family transcriptional regulator [Ralstonia pseudosolanacearum]MDO3511798.1 AraC family transcriptional regulator [Ralstonia pseudosolanacearum]MDO3538605.1 AraC family transcriptional regulator [Ralstonia pseudosolanacearum]MDO3559756.1 AraC family transcriptional regulator [Ralstonia pseudosolanacearum]